jgi:hypothetical protein
MAKQNQLYRRGTSSRGQPFAARRPLGLVLSVIFGLIALAVCAALADDASKQAASPQPPAQPSSAEPAAGEEINWQVISGGGGTRDTSNGYRLGGTVGQTAVGSGGCVLPSCCNTDSMRGDADGDGAINVNDPTYLTNYIFFGGPAPPCQDPDGSFPEGDADGSGSINVGDPTYLTNYIFHIPPDPPPEPCPGYRLNHGFWQSF